MKIRLSDHLKFKAKVRNISASLPKKIVKEAEKIYFDKETRHWIAVKEEKYTGKIRPIVAVFDKTNGDIEIITIFPNDINEVNSRIKRGRWIHEKTKN
ncbi:hypothetical protein A2954_00440 [Candidatus Roizmanbacteria bacterium RIFCSPLOWO2_01_FULL_37_12]|uniref:DUF4258 domain-containing protein n=1 Tax=Candidatus Roizmanbacteria bacterium RIFCSPLOWO2_01_FULL_37_12 TaxID=1802056 RepID=A0A1F7ICX6_9BACT|nr:MAG: hypothetical protein A2768_00075 [Candidatus Roizmanbacteria bacterium RIFCSPHIGHO2_01_FULL_37_16]OGK23296.1 MAG: hypothetical protein A3D76_00760 [Candidatus Roizmanbacteria bacterium RIFCSPHIGHO2_02_FULL_37_9b]OGK41206.1 MAG: hypothetical protein A2954_00440 [Candidatus Roizmanbacteria bacterium RIFCSPLOWO2_01_FULL_37_12]